MNDKTVDFFQELNHRGYGPMLGNVTGKVRFDISRDGQTSSRRLIVNNGRLLVSPEEGPPPENDDVDCVIATDKGRFDGIVGDGVNAMAALLRGEIAVAGDPELLVSVQRLFPTSTRVVEGAREGAGADESDSSPQEAGDREL